MDDLHRSTVISWVDSQLSGLGLNVTTAPENIVSTQWSTVTKFNTSGGAVYLKEAPAELALEAETIALLQRLNCPAIPRVIAVNKKLNCFLMQSAGEVTLEEQLLAESSFDYIEEGVRQYTAIQHITSEHIQQFEQLGLPNWSLGNIEALYGSILAKQDWLLSDGLTQAEIETLEVLTPELVRYCNTLACYEIPDALNHCDFHDNNMIFSRDNKIITIIDWAETVITHPFLSLASCLYKLRRSYSAPGRHFNESRIIEVCLNNWQDYGHDRHLHEAFCLAEKINPIFVALNFARMADATAWVPNGRVAKALKHFIAGVRQD